MTNKQGGKKTAIIGLVALILAIVCTVVWAIGSNGFKQNNPLKFFNGWGTGAGTGAVQPDGTGDSGNKDSFESGAVLDSSENNGIGVLSAQLPRSAYAANGVSEQAENAYTLTAEVSPDYATDRTLDWSVSWQDSESEWASGKTVTDYVTVTPTEDGAFTAVCACMQDFGEVIVLTASSRSNPEVKGMCFVQYYQRVKSCDYAFYYDGEEVTPNLENGVYKFDYTGAEKDYTVELKPVYSNYTLTDTYTTTKSGHFSNDFGYTASSNFSTLMLSAGLSGGEPKSTGATMIWQGLDIFAKELERDNPELVELGDTYERYILYRSAPGHPRYEHVKDLLPKFTYHREDWFGIDKCHMDSYPTAEEIRACLNSYVAPPYSYMGGVSFNSYDDFVTAVNRCNANNVGVIEYTIKINGAHSSFETVLNLGYNSNLKTNVQNVNLSESNINF